MALAMFLVYIVMWLCFLYWLPLVLITCFHFLQNINKNDIPALLLYSSSNIQKQPETAHHTYSSYFVCQRYHYWQMCAQWPLCLFAYYSLLVMLLCVLCFIGSSIMFVIKMKKTSSNRTQYKKRFIIS